MKRKNWTKEEENYLEEWAGIHPINYLVKRFNKTFNLTRSEQSVKTKMQRLGLRQRTELDYLTKLQWAKLLGHNNGFIMTKWERKGLVVNRQNQYQHYITKRSMMQFARQYPHLFYHADSDVLDYYLGEELTQLIKQSKDPLSKSKKIRTSDGRVFSSQRQAAKVLNLSPRTIGRELKRPDGWLTLIDYV